METISNIIRIATFLLACATCPMSIGVALFTLWAFIDLLQKRNIL